MPTALRPDVGDVTTPNLIGALDSELAVQPVRDIRPVLAVGITAQKQIAPAVPGLFLFFIPEIAGRSILTIF